MRLNLNLTSATALAITMGLIIAANASAGSLNLQSNGSTLASGIGPNQTISIGESAFVNANEIAVNGQLHDPANDPDDYYQWISTLGNPVVLFNSTNAGFANTLCGGSATSHAQEPAPCRFAANSSAATGTYYFKLHVYDGGATGTSPAAASVTVTNALLVLSFLPQNAEVYEGQSVAFTNSTAGGTGSNAYSYNAVPGTGFAEQGNNFTFSAPGIYSVTLRVTDASNESANASSQVTVLQQQPTTTTGCGSCGHIISSTSTPSSTTTVQASTAASTVPTIATTIQAPPSSTTAGQNILNAGSAPNASTTMGISTAVTLTRLAGSWWLLLLLIILIIAIIMGAIYATKRGRDKSGSVVATSKQQKQQ